MESNLWFSLLQESRDARGSPNQRFELAEKFRSHSYEWKKQLEMYNMYFRNANLGKESLTESQKEEKKKLIINTRAALRYGISCLSIDDECSRREIQKNAIIVCQVNIPLTYILTQKQGDSKCRLLSSRLLSNLVTSNVETSIHVVSCLPLSPALEDVSNRMKDDNVLFESTSSSEEILHGKSINPNWLDMILCSAQCGDRDSVAAIVAAIHNCIVSLTEESSELHAKSRWFEEIARDSMLMNNLLRNLISVESVKTLIETKSKNPDNVEKQDDNCDSATEWITILIAKLSRLGMLNKMYTAMGDKLEESSASCNLQRILPEQLTLLHCLAKEAEHYMETSNNEMDMGHLFGGEVGWDGVTTSHKFLVDLFSALRSSVFQKGSKFTSLVTTEKDDEEYETQLMQSGIVTVLDMLAVSLSRDCSTSEQLRLYLGSQTTILQQLAQDLGLMVDGWIEQSFGRKASEIQISKVGQQMITSLVRLQGNLCFNCCYNQDQMRQIVVPDTRQSMNVHRQQEGDGSTSTNDEKSEEKRTALHVLLSCTSFAHSCFTLREWAVIAIRNTLDKNEKNQEVVARLEAQQPMQGAELSQAGLRVEMDGRSGKVSVKPVAKEDEANIQK